MLLLTADISSKVPLMTGHIMAVAAEFDIHIDTNIVINNILKCNLLERVLKNFTMSQTKSTNIGLIKSNIVIPSSHHTSLIGL